MTISDAPSTPRDFETTELVPRAWLGHPGAGPVHGDCPAIIRVAGHLVMAYVAVLPDRSVKIAMCLLRDDWIVAEDSLSPVSDMFVYADSADNRDRTRMADPRLAVLGGRLYMGFCAGSGPIPDQAYLVEIDAKTRQPIGSVRPVVRDECHGSMGKSWPFFEHGDDVFVIDKLAPLTILRADISDPHRVTLNHAYTHEWDSWSYENAYGALTPGATPVLHDGRYYLLGRSEFAGDADDLPPDSESRCHVGALIVLAGDPPFAPELYSASPLIELTSMERTLPHPPRPDRARVEVAYPTGLVADDRGLTVSYGINNAHAALRNIDWAAVARALIPVIPRSPRADRAQAWLGRDVRTEAQPAAVSPVEQGRLTCRAFWWRPGHVSPRSTQRAANLARHRFVHGNFGDIFAPHLLGRMTGAEPQHHEDNPKLLTVGSVIRTARDGDVLWGTGLNGAYAQMIHAPKHLHIYATRGPISYDFLRRGGFDVSRVGAVFDPGSLVGHLFQPEIAALRQHIGDPPRDFILIPHFSDETVMRELYPQYADRIRSVDAPFFETVAEILRSNLVISSSLHGLIVAEALGVPAIWHRPLKGVDELKFTDYYLGTGRYRIVRVDTLQDAFKSSPMPLPVLDTAAMLATFPSLADLDAYGVIVRHDDARESLHRTS
jgi:Polysaccharide pyruvyl transferase